MTNFYMINKLKKKIAVLLMQCITMPIPSALLSFLSKFLNTTFIKRIIFAEAELYEEMVLKHNKEVLFMTKNWRPIGDLCSTYSFHDEKCPDVKDYLTKSGRWQLAKIGKKYGLHQQNDRHLSYTITPVPHGYRFVSDGKQEHWINLISKSQFPQNYALDFDLIPHTIFEEQCQIAFAMRDLAERHRFVVEFGNRVYYQIVHRWTFLQAIKSFPLAIHLHMRIKIRFEMIGNQFSLKINNRLIFSEKNSAYSGKSNFGALVFWNGDPNFGGCHPMDFEIQNFRLLTAE